MRLVLLAIFLSLALAGCRTAVQTEAAPQTVNANKPRTPDAVYQLRQHLVGAWYGDQRTTHGGRRRWIMRRAADGTFRVSFHTVDPVEGNYDETEVGVWGVSGRYLITLTQGWARPDGTVEASPSQSPYFWDLYEVLSLTNDEFSCLSIETGDRFQSRRVADDFTLPE